MKYRGINKINNNFVYGYYSVDNDLHQIHTEHTVYPVYSDTISLFFGKKDKNGEEIYTNDKEEKIKREFFNL